MFVKLALERSGVDVGKSRILRQIRAQLECRIEYAEAESIGVAAGELLSYP